MPTHARHSAPSGSRRAGGPPSGSQMETTELILFIDDAPTEAAMFDRDMRYLAASRAWLETTRQTRDIIGRSHYDIFPALPDSWRI